MKKFKTFLKWIGVNTKQTPITPRPLTAQEIKERNVRDFCAWLNNQPPMAL